MRKADSSSEETREQILFTASKLFMQRGYAKTKVLDIVREMRITPSTLYWYFESKEELLFEYLKGAIEEFNELMIEALVGHDDPLSQLRSTAYEHTKVQLLFREQAQTVLSLSPASAELINSLSKDHTVVINHLYRQHIDRVRGIVKEGIEIGVFHAESVNALAFAILNMCEYAAMWFRPEGSDTIESVANANAEFAVRMATGQMSRPLGVPNQDERPSTT